MTCLSWAAAHLVQIWEVKIDMSGPSKDCLWVCNVKMKKNFTRAETGHISMDFWVSGRSIE